MEDIEGSYKQWIPLLAEDTDKVKPRTKDGLEKILSIR